jgi:signal transduction histidine kinase
MEAVGRLASEVAVTCDGLLRDVTRDAHEWLSAIASDDPRRQQVERLLTDVTRAASFLRHLGVYGATQARALEPVSVQRVLRDLAPVLKQVVGDGIDVVAPKSSGSFDVDVDAERVERILVNVAAYARERMPKGGQVRIDLATTAVGRKLVAKHPSVRPGPHVLITVTELPRAEASRAEDEHTTSSSDKPGVDLGGLMDLVSTAGGHLWIDAQPAGNLIVKIHLPQPAGIATSGSRRSDTPSDLGGRLARWLRLGSSTDVRA